MDAAVRLETACVNKLFECEETNAELHPRKKKYLTGLGDIIKKYRQKIHKTKETVNQACDKPLIEISELKALDEQEGRLKAIHPAFNAFKRRKKAAATKPNNNE